MSRISAPALEMLPSVYIEVYQVHMSAPRRKCSATAG
jgi:hypothetical protein